jgi:hypothetical protein
MSEETPATFKAANVHGKSANIATEVNEWLKENEDDIAKIIQVTMSTHIVPGDSGLPIPWSNVLIIYKPKQPFGYS